MAFKARAHRLDNGDYTLEFGKGGNKLSVILRGSSKGWDWKTCGDNPPRFKMKRDAIAAWEIEARDSYTGTNSSGIGADAVMEPPRANTQRAPIAASPESAPEGVPQLRIFFSKADSRQIQECINCGPSRTDQIHRWYQAWLTTGVEYELPQVDDRPTVVEPPLTPKFGLPPKFNGKTTKHDKNKKETSEEGETLATNVDAGIDPEETEVPC